MEVLFPLQPRREGNRLYKTSNYLSLSFRKTCNAALWQKAFSFSYSMGYCAVSLQLLVILEKCWLEGGGFPFDNRHLLLETDKGINSLSLGKGDVCEKTQAKLLSVTERWANLFPWHRVKLQAVAQHPCSLATQSQNRTTAKIALATILPSFALICSGS